MEQEKIQQLERRIVELEKVLKEHQHLGNDGSKEFDGAIKISARDIEIQGAGDKVGEFTIIPFKIYDAIKGDKRGAGMGIANFGTKKATDEQAQAILTVGTKVDFEKIEPLNKTDFSEYFNAELTLSLLPQLPATASGPTSFPPWAFLSAKRTPYIKSTGTVSGNILVDQTANFENDLAGSLLSLSNQETKKIVSNTSNTITVAEDFTSLGSYTYEVITPIFLGSANIPFSRLYVGDDIRLGYGSSGGSQVRYIKWGSGSPEGVVTANIGSLYLRSDGSTSTTLYIKTANNGLPTGWTAK